MNLAAVDLNLLVAFDTMMQLRSVSRAAECLGLRQPAMSATLSRLRKLLGNELFVRAAGAMQPTPLALRIAPGVAEALATLRVTLAPDVAFDPDGAGREFSIASTDYTSLVLAPKIVARFRAEAPSSRLRIIGYDKADIASLIDRGEIDLALGTFRLPPERAVVRRLCAEHFVGLARRGHPSFDGGRVTLASYLAAPHALVSVSRDRTGAVDTALAARGLSRRVVLSLPHMVSLPSVLADSDLLAAVPSRLTMRLSNEMLQSFDLPIPVPSWHIEMLWNPAARSDRAHGWLRALVAEVASGI